LIDLWRGLITTRAAQLVVSVDIVKAAMIIEGVT
jgi:hypothetical protein